MNSTINVLLEGSTGRPIMLDARLDVNAWQKPVIIFSHGFKGFKDWGAFNLLAEKFAVEGFVFVKFNYSHNGITPAAPFEFTDLEAFANNNYSIELNDLDRVITEVLKGGIIPITEIDIDRIFLLGHSRGGGLSIIKAHEDKRIKKTATWAAVNNLGWGWTDDILEKWKQTGIRFTENKRTGQKMPLNYQLAENYLLNKERLDIEKAVKAINIPFMAIHGSEDEIPVRMAIEMKGWNPDVQLEILEGANHVFGASHPYLSEKLPPDLQTAFTKTVEFFKEK
jgi:pimeloyl-ACP methyl ester carboxylesterase